MPVDLVDAPSAIVAALAAPDGRALAVNSVNLDHIHHFGSRSSLAGAFGIREGRYADLKWLHLIDGAPVAAHARRVTGQTWPRLAGSDLIGALLDSAEAKGRSIGVLGGRPETQAKFAAALSWSHPRLRLAGLWSPTRDDLLDDARSHAIVDSIDRNGAGTGAKVMLAFGAVVDFIAGEVERAPRWVVDRGLEWSWRLAMEPRRLYRRYLIQGPNAYRDLRRTQRAA